MDKLFVEIKLIQEMIWENDLNRCRGKVLGLIECVHTELLQITAIQQRQMVDISKKILMAVEDNDYLRLADILEYELKPAIIKHIEGEGENN